MMTTVIKILVFISSSSDCTVNSLSWSLKNGLDFRPSWWIIYLLNWRDSKRKNRQFTSIIRGVSRSSYRLIYFVYFTNRVTERTSFIRYLPWLVLLLLLPLSVPLMWLKPCLSFIKSNTDGTFNVQKPKNKTP